MGQDAQGRITTMTKHQNGEPNWQEGCAGDGVKPGKECRDCLFQRGHFGYALVNGQWSTTP